MCMCVCVYVSVKYDWTTKDKERGREMKIGEVRKKKCKDGGKLGEMNSQRERERFEK